MRDLRAHGVDVVTIGQYLQPSSRHAPIDRWVHPDEFRWFREQSEAMGFGSVFSGPLVRSSYRADEQRHAAETRARGGRVLADRPVLPVGERFALAEAPADEVRMLRRAQRRISRAPAAPHGGLLDCVPLEEVLVVTAAPSAVALE